MKYCDMQSRVNRLKAQYPEGTVIELISMDDKQAPPAGTKGTVIGVDDIGQILVHWESGGGLNLIPWIDKFKIISGPTQKGSDLNETDTHR